MTDQAETKQPKERSIKTPWWNPIATNPSSVWILILVLLAARVIWQIISPYTLIEDEAHYWEWSRNLDWSYYSKGPGVAWTIWLSTTILGHTEYAIRIPAAIAAAIGAYAVAKIAKDHFQDQRLVFVSALLYACVPGFAVASMIMTIDSPYIASWAFASVFALRIVLNTDPTSNPKQSRSNWIYLGLWIAIGFIFKYTILLLLPGFILALILTRSVRAHTNTKLNPKHIALAILFALLGLVPVLVWNAGHDWATVRHLLGHLGAPGGDTQPTAAYQAEPWTILWMLEYVGLQFAVGGPVVILSLFAWINSKKHATPQTQITITILIALALPILFFYFLVSLVTQTEGNWAMAGFVTLIPVAAWSVIDGVSRSDHPVKFAWGAAIFIGSAILFLFPGATWLSKQPVIGPKIPLYRMTGMREHAEDVAQTINNLKEYSGQEPIIMSEHYGRASLLAFYLPGKPTVYCTSAQVGGRKTQYDMWTHTDLANPETLKPLLGRPGILFGGKPHHWDCAFDQFTNIGKFKNEPKEHRTSYMGFNFHTFETWIPPQPEH